MNQNALATIDRDEANHALALSKGTSIAAFVPTDFAGLMTVATMMAHSGSAIAKHCRNNPGVCMSIAMTAYQNGFNPWLLANDSYVVNDQVAYGGKSIIAMVNNSPKLQGRLRYTFSGDWPNRRLRVVGRIRGEPEELDVEVKAETITTRNSPNWKQQPDQQLRYYAGRMWARAHMPEVTLGLLAEDEADDLERGADGTYAPPTARPTRADYAQPVTTTVAEPDPEPVYDFIDEVGEVLADDLPALAWIERYTEHLGRLKDTRAIDTFIENNEVTAETIISEGRVGNAADVISEVCRDARERTKQKPQAGDLAVRGGNAIEWVENFTAAVSAEPDVPSLAARQQANQHTLDRLKGDDEALWTKAMAAVRERAEALTVSETEDAGEQVQDGGAATGTPYCGYEAGDPGPGEGPNRWAVPYNPDLAPGKMMPFLSEATKKAGACETPADWQAFAAANRQNLEHCRDSKGLAEPGKILARIDEALG